MFSLLMTWSVFRLVLPWLRLSPFFMVHVRGSVNLDSAACREPDCLACAGCGPASSSPCLRLDPALLLESFLQHLADLLGRRLGADLDLRAAARFPVNLHPAADHK